MGLEGQGCATTRGSVATSLLYDAAGHACSLLCTSMHDAAVRFELLDGPAVMFGTHWEVRSTLGDSGQAMPTFFLLQ